MSTQKSLYIGTERLQKRATHPLGHRALREKRP
jgi:hypothetical protein